MTGTKKIYSIGLDIMKYPEKPKYPNANRGIQLCDRIENKCSKYESFDIMFTLGHYNSTVYIQMLSY